MRVMAVERNTGCVLMDMDGGAMTAAMCRIVRVSYAPWESQVHYKLTLWGAILDLRIDLTMDEFTELFSAMRLPRTASGDEVKTLPLPGVVPGSSAADDDSVDLNELYPNRGAPENPA